MRVGRFITLAAVAVAASACFHQVIQTGRTPGTTVIDKPWANSFIFGLVPVAPIDVSSQCRSGIATVVTEMSAMNGLVGILTLGIYTPVHVTITCAASGGGDDNPEFSISRDASVEERNAVFARAIEMSSRTGKPVQIRF
jgi:hypothetical protein